MLLRVSGLLLLTTASLPAQFIQQGNKLVGTGAIGYSEQGSSAALSSDGNTAIVGGWYDNTGVGAAWIYTRSSGAWTQQGPKLIGTGAIGPANQGCAVAISADGNTVIVGGSSDNHDYSVPNGSFRLYGTGAAWVFTRSSGVWSQQGSKLVGTGAISTQSSGAGQGYSVALSADGNTAILGGWHDDYLGAAWVFTRSGATWTQQGDKLVGAGAVPVPGPVAVAQGSSVALSADGNVALVGGAFDGNLTGATWVYTRSAGVWTQQGPKLVGAGSTGLTEQGFSVALSGDGSTALIGGYGNSAAWLFTNNGGLWSQQGPKLVAAGTSQLGISVALSADGNTALLGGHGQYFSQSGGGFEYTRSGGVWSQQGPQLAGSGSAVSGGQGSSVALSGDGNTAIVSGPGDNTTMLSNGYDVATGAVWMFARATTPTIAPGAVVNGATFQPGIAPGEWITIIGANLSATTRSWTAADLSGNNLPTELDGVSVTVNGKPAYVAYVSPTQLNVLAPDDTAQSLVEVQAMTPQGSTNIVNTTEAPLSPALFMFSQQAARYVAAVRSDGTYIGPPNLIPGLSTVPAKAGDTILIFGTGFGPTTPPSMIGQAVTPAPLANPVTVYIGGVVANTQFAGITAPGLYQFNVIVPNGVPTGDQTVVVAIGGSSTQSSALLNVQP